MKDRERLYLLILDDEWAQAKTYYEELTSILRSVLCHQLEMLGSENGQQLIETFCQTTKEVAFFVLSDVVETDWQGLLKLIIEKKLSPKKFILLSNENPGMLPANVVWIHNKTYVAKNDAQTIADIYKGAVSPDGIGEASIEEVLAQKAVERATTSLSILKHRIAHIFLSIDIDLQGIRAEGTTDYLKQVLRGKKEITNSKDNPIYYRRKLSDSHYLLVGERIEKPSGETLSILCGEVKGCSLYEYVERTQSLQLAENNKAVYDLIGGKLKEEEERDIEQVTIRWDEIRLLAGLDRSTGNFSPDLNSPIFLFMCLLDCKINKIKDGEQIRHKDVEDILYFSWGDLEMWEQIDSFHKWFRELDESMAMLREVMT